MRLTSKNILITVFVIALVLGITFLTFNDNGKVELSINEKNWIQKNKNDLIDLEIPSSLPVLSEDGKGVIFDFLNNLEKDTDLDFNKLSYRIDEKPNSEYKITKTDKIKDNDLLLYQDSYALIGKDKEYFEDTSKVFNKTIGVLKEDQSKVSKYLNNQTFTYKSYDSINTMINDLKNGQVNYIALPKITNLEKILEENLYFVHNIYDYQENYVIELGKNSTLNSILKKYYKNYQDKLTSSFTKNLVLTYFNLENISEKDQTEFRSKRYAYGFINNIPYDFVTSDGMMGINYDLLSSFASATNSQFEFKKYNNISSLKADFNANKLDIIFDNGYTKKYKVDVLRLPSINDEKVVAISKNNNVTVRSIDSLINNDVVCLKDSLISKELKDENVSVKEYDTTKSTLSHLKDNDIALIDNMSYDYYIRNDLKNYNNLGTFNLKNNYSFVSRDIKENKILNNTLYFYLTFINTNVITNNSYKKIINYNRSIGIFKVLLIVFVIILIIIGLIFIIRYLIKHRKDPKNLSKTDKLRYIDTLTSLKNRTFLNENMNAWDISDVYPKTVVVIDLNNVAYINDNFGHAEGDKVIVEAAGILIDTQLSKSEIIRSNGNEFLVFIIGHDEKTIISYIRKLNKELKNISHGFGAAIGYSMILDEVKTIDDAINEATNDMKKNKENR